MATGTIDAHGAWWRCKLTLTADSVTTIAGCSQLGVPNGTSCNAAGNNAIRSWHAAQTFIGYQTDMQVTKNRFAS